MSEKLKLTPEERRELKAIFMSLWHERGEGYNKATSTPESADVWFAAVCDFLTVRENRLKDSNDSSKDSEE